MKSRSGQERQQLEAVAALRTGRKFAATRSLLDDARVEAGGENLAVISGAEWLAAEPRRRTRTFAVSRSRSRGRDIPRLRADRERERETSSPSPECLHPITASLVIPYPSHPNISIPCVYNHPSSLSPSSTSSSSSSNLPSRENAECNHASSAMIYAFCWRPGVAGCTLAGWTHTYKRARLLAHECTCEYANRVCTSLLSHRSFSGLYRRRAHIAFARALEHRELRSPLAAVCIRDCAQTAASRYRQVTPRAFSRGTDGPRGSSHSLARSRTTVSFTKSFANRTDRALPLARELNATRLQRTVNTLRSLVNRLSRHGFSELSSSTPVLPPSL